MNLQTIYKQLPSALSFGVNSVKRGARTASTLGKTGLDYLAGRPACPPVLLRRAFERMGATYIKLGQLIASSPTLFPEAYVREFQRCLDSTEPVPFVQMEKILRQEFGRQYIPEIFSDIDPTPIASASIAQVYAAKLATGEDVVIKIQRPGVQDILIADLNPSVVTAGILEKFIPRLQHVSLRGILSEIRRTVLEECDFVKEAENIKIFSEFLQKNRKSSVVTPLVYPEASSRLVLTMERLYGIPLTDREQFLKSTENPNGFWGRRFKPGWKALPIANYSMRICMPAILLILQDGRVGFIDFGIVGRISKKTKEGVNSLMKAMILNDYELMAESMLAIGMTKKEVDTESLSNDLKELYLAGRSLEEDNLYLIPRRFTRTRPVLA